MNGEWPLLMGVGGFLGAGKTTTLLGVAARLRERGLRVSLITNDQASGLVDTAAARAALDEQDVAEIAGGCFCCRFDDLARALHEVIDRSEPDVILAEAVGSCTDLAATVYQPLRQLDLAPVRLGPLTVVADGTRLRSFRRFASLPQLPQTVGYLYGKQLQEADVLLLNKVDLLDPGEAGELTSYLQGQHPGVPVLPVSALTGAGLDTWLDRLAAQADAGQRVLELDYDAYADAEAALGWLNVEGAVALGNDGGSRGSAWSRAVLDHLAEAARDAGAEVAHAKLRLESPSGACAANVVGAGGTAVRFTDEPRGEAQLVLNARVATSPETLRRWVEAAIAAGDRTAGAQTALREVACFAPARPVPTYRLGVQGQVARSK